MDNSDYIKIFTDNFIVVQPFLESLKENNIPFIVKDESESSRLAGFGTSIKGLQDVFVPKNNSAQALELLKDFL
ncbi:DUF2007 domain-containing protein [Aquimarina agarivorans]|uniref:DUF2007 domain-containing protein n=1 Tax=Aquimarina agarivorans TaxID=980584 RepID=UPI000248EAEE|nr:DUF2007 domain-containing protein [Aquimarina agarivorans]